MKNAVIGFGLIVMVALSILIHSSIASADTRTNETEDSLRESISIAIKQTNNSYSLNFDEAHEDGADIVEPVEAYIAEFTKNLALLISTDSTLDISVVDADINLGCIRVSVTETFTYPNGKADTITVDKTIFIEQENE